MGKQKCKCKDCDNKWVGNPIVCPNCGSTNIIVQKSDKNIGYVIGIFLTLIVIVVFLILSFLKCSGDNEEKSEIRLTLTSESNNVFIKVSNIDTLNNYRIGMLNQNGENLIIKKINSKDSIASFSSNEMPLLGEKYKFILLKNNKQITSNIKWDTYNVYTPKPELKLSFDKVRNVATVSVLNNNVDTLLNKFYLMIYKNVENGEKNIKSQELKFNITQDIERGVRYGFKVILNKEGGNDDIGIWQDGINTLFIEDSDYQDCNPMETIDEFQKELDKYCNSAKPQNSNFNYSKFKINSTLKLKSPEKDLQAILVEIEEDARIKSFNSSYKVTKYKVVSMCINKNTGKILDNTLCLEKR